MNKERINLLCNLHNNHLNQLLKDIQSYLGYDDEVFEEYLINSRDNIELLQAYMDRHPHNFAIITANTDDMMLTVDCGNDLNSSDLEQLDGLIDFIRAYQTDFKSEFIAIFCKD